jgi:hypothetical protein
LAVKPRISRVEENMIEMQPHLAEKAEFRAIDVAQPEANIIEDVAQFVRRFVFLRNDVLYDLVSAWIIATYLLELFDYVGYIFAHSPEPQSGKSRLLEVLDLLVNNSTGILVSPTEAVIFRTAKSTQLIDEVDSCIKREELRGVLNAGFQRNGFVFRMREAEGSFKPERHDVYAPRALAGIGENILHVATRDRSFMFEMVRQTKNERREEFRIRRVKPDADVLKARIENWVNENKQQIEKLYDQFAFTYLEEFRDRTIDIAQPISTVIEVAYAGNPKLQRARNRLLDAISLTRREERSIQEQHKVLRQLVHLADSEDLLVGSPSELAEMCAKLLDGDAPESNVISSTLRQYGFKPKSHRKNGGQPTQRYVLPKAELLEILERYDVKQAAEVELKGEANFPKTGFAAPLNPKASPGSALEADHVE